MKRFRKAHLFRICFICAGACAGLGIDAMHEPSTAAEKKPPERVTLPIVVHPQETELWCWAATGQMTMEFLGKQVSQSEQANRLFRRMDCDERPVPKPCIRGGLVVIPYFGFTSKVTKSPLSEQEVVRQIYTLRKPIPFGWSWPGGGGHIGLVAGYSRDMEGALLLEIIDPFPPAGKNSENPDGGQRGFMPYKRWAGGSPDYVFDHALFNVAKTPSAKE